MQTLAQLKNGTLKGITHLKLCEGLTDFPLEIFELADTLQILDLSGNQLNQLPADLGRLQQLKILFCSGNPFTELPEVLGDCPKLEMVGFKSCRIERVADRALNPNLRWLILTDNRITELPASIGQCTRLEKVALAGNRLTQLPATMANCRNIGLLRISANRLKALPEWITGLPNLSWLGFSGNPFCIKPAVQPLPLIEWNNIVPGKVLGQGASGVIYRSVLTLDGEKREVAVKLYKGEVTSDGSPEDEMNAAILAGEHEGLVRNIGQITNHPEGRMGLVMELIPERFHNLGMPPSLDSCTRDVFAPGMRISLQKAVTIARTIASAAAHLHSRGILHGDLYAHNTLIDEYGHALTNDFGAATFYNTTDAGTANTLQRIEVRAFGCMLDDLLGLCAEVEPTEERTLLLQLRAACWLPDVAARPTFAWLHKQLVGTLY